MLKISKRKNTFENVWGVFTGNSTVHGLRSMQNKNNRVNETLSHIDELSKRWRNSPRVVQSVNDSVKNVNTGVLSSLAGAGFVIGSGILISVLQTIGTQAVVSALMRSGAIRFISNTAYSAISATPWALSKIGNISCWGAKGFYSLTKISGNYSWIAINVIGGKAAIWSLKFIGKYSVRLGIPTGVSAWLAGFAEDLDDMLNIANLLGSNAKANKDANFSSALMNKEIANELMTFHSTLGAVAESQAEELAKMKVESNSPDFATTVATTAVENAVNDGGSWWLATLGMITVVVILTPIALISYDYYYNDSRCTTIAGCWVAEKAEELYNLIPEAWRFWKSVKEDDSSSDSSSDLSSDSDFGSSSDPNSELLRRFLSDNTSAEEKLAIWNSLEDGPGLAAEPENID